MHLEDVVEAGLPAGTAWSVEIRRLDRPEPVLELNPGALLRTASVAKVFLLVEVAARIHAGRLDADRLLDRESVAPVADSGLLQHLAVRRLAVADLARLVGSVSDNLATNLLLAEVGLEAVQRRARELAPGGSMLHDVVRDQRSAGVPAALSSGCASDWVRVFAALRTGGVVDQQVSRQVLDWLANGADLSMLASALDLDPLAHAAADGAGLWHKTGTDAGVRADVGLVRRGAQTWAYAAICNWEPGAVRTGAVLAAMRELGRAISAPPPGSP